FHASILAAPVVKGAIGYAKAATNVSHLDTCFMFFDGANNLFFAVTLLHVETSSMGRLMEISSMSWFYFWGIGQCIPLLSCFSIPFQSLSIVLTNTIPIKIHNT